MNIENKLNTIAEDVPKVYDAGKRAQYEAFWDAFQRNGARTGYYGSFCSMSRDAFYPKYDIVLSGSTGAFSTFRTFPDSAAASPSPEDFELVVRLNECGVQLHTRGATRADQTFYYSCVTHLPQIDFSSVTGSFNETFYYCNRLHTIDQIVLSSEEAPSFYNTFVECSKLKNIEIEGKIRRSISFAQSPLTPASAKSIIYALVDYSGTSSEKTYKLTLAESVWSDLEADSTAPDGGGWREYVDSLGWNT